MSKEYKVLVFNTEQEQWQKLMEQTKKELLGASIHVKGRGLKGPANELRVYESREIIREACANIFKGDPPPALLIEEYPKNGVRTQIATGTEKPTYYLPVANGQSGRVIRGRNMEMDEE